MRKRKKILSGFILGICMAAAISGCAKTTEEKGEKEVATEAEAESQAATMGRYVEQAIEMPPFEEFEVIKAMVEYKGETILYTYVSMADTKGMYQTYRLLEDQSWGKEECKWLNQAVGDKNLSVNAIRVGGIDSLYAWYFDDNYQAHIVKSSDGISAEEIKIDDLTKEENLPNGFVVDAQGNIAIAYMGGSMSENVVLYNPQDGSEIRRFPIGSMSTDNICGLLDVKEERLVGPSEDTKGFTVYNLETGEVIEEIKVELEKEYEILDGLIQIGPDGDYYYISSAGLSHTKQGGSITEAIIDGSLNTMGITGIYGKALIVGENQDYTVLFQDDTKMEVAHYVYDETVPTIPSIQLTMFGLSENKSIARAIGTFQKENPDVQVVYNTAQMGEGATTIADSIRTLNTELLSDKGADILLLDGLPMESYIEKGVLADISDIVGPIQEEGKLLESITKSYKREDGKIYGIPARFSMPILLGDKETNQAFQSLDALTKYAQNNMGNEFLGYHFRTITYEELAAFILNVNAKEILGEGNKLEKEVLVKYLKTVEQVGKAIGATVNMEAKPPETMESIGNVQEGYLEEFSLGGFPTKEGTTQSMEIGGIIDMVQPIGLKDQLGKEISSANQQYIPSGIIGVNSNSKQLDLAKKFIACVLSEEEQKKDLSDGMPIQVKALESYCLKESNISFGVGYEENGERIQFYFEWPQKEEITEIIDLAKTLTVPLNIDRVFKEMILSEAKPLWEGSITPEKAADAILTKANTYLAE